MQHSDKGEVGGSRAPVILYELGKRARADYHIGLSAWTDKSMLEQGHFYPSNAEIWRLHVR